MTERMGEGSDGLARDLPRDAQLDHRAAGARLSGRPPAAAKGRCAISRGCSSMTRRTSASSPASRRSGTRRSHVIALAESGRRSGASRRSARGRSGWRRRKCASAATGRSRIRTPRRAAGRSSSTTSITRTPTTPTMVLMALRLRPQPRRRKLGCEAMFERALALAAQLPVPRRRLGGVRQGRDPALARGRALCRSQRDPRPDLQRPHRPHARAARLHRLRPRRAHVRAPRASRISATRRRTTARGTAAGA